MISLRYHSDINFFSNFREFEEYILFRALKKCFPAKKKFQKRLPCKLAFWSWIGHCSSPSARRPLSFWLRTLDTNLQLWYFTHFVSNCSVQAVPYVTISLPHPVQITRRTPTYKLSVSPCKSILVHFFKNCPEGIKILFFLQGLTFYLGFCIFTAVLGMLQFGYNTGVINAPESVMIFSFLAPLKKIWIISHSEKITTTFIAFVFPR